MNDLISRQEAIKELEEQLYYNDADEGIIIHGTPFWNSDLVKGIIKNDVPSAEPKKGKWIKNDNGTYSCNLCQSWIPEEQYHYARFCLHCGAEMIKE